MSEFTTLGFHHVTMVSSNAAKTLAFYRDVLGFRLVKKTVNFDMPETYHLYFADDAGSPGTILTFFEWPRAVKGSYGLGGVHHVALGTKDQDTQLMWKRWLNQHGIRVSGPYNRGWFWSIYFSDPDGQILEIATEGPGFATDEPIDKLGQRLILPDESRLPSGRDEAEIAARNWPEPIEGLTSAMALDGIHHITGIAADLVAEGDFYEQALGMRLVKKSVNQDSPDALHYFWANYDGTRVLPHSDFTLFKWPGDTRRTREGVGQTHHVAYRAESPEQLAAWRERLLSIGLGVSEIRDRSYFQSIYFRSPDGLLVEIASDTPGFAIDEPAATMGSELRVPAWLESRKDEIAERLQPLS